MSSKRFLRPGEFYFGSDALVETLLGPCVAITLWFPLVRKGGICHFMLPQRGRHLPVHQGDPDGRYGREAWLWLVQQVSAHDLLLAEAEIKLFGGSRVLVGQAAAKASDIGNQNISVAEACVSEAGLLVSGRDVGGDGHRVLRFDLQTGDVWVRRGAAISKAVIKEIQQ
jgi:chemotaxis protein CheD